MMLIRSKIQCDKLIYLTILTLITLLSYSCAAMTSPSMNTIKEIGEYSSPENSFKANITVSGLGGFKICEIFDGIKKIHRIEDVNALVWINKSEILYSVSPIYGNPGIFIFDCIKKRKRTIVKPKRLSVAYPNGADYFEIKGYDGSTRELWYYYATDVDKIDFKNFRNEKNILTQKLK